MYRYRYGLNGNRNTCSNSPNAHHRNWNGMDGYPSTQRNQSPTIRSLWVLYHQEDEGGMPLYVTNPKCDMEPNGTPRSPLSPGPTPSVRVTLLKPKDRIPATRDALRNGGTPCAYEKGVRHRTSRAVGVGPLSLRLAAKRGIAVTRAGRWHPRQSPAYSRDRDPQGLRAPPLNGTVAKGDSRSARAWVIATACINRRAFTRCAASRPSRRSPQ
jgi:hypothetical protein